MPQPSSRVTGFTESVIREMTRRAMQVNAINLAQGFPDFPPPPAFTEAMAVAAAEGPQHQYTINWGSPALRSAVAEKVGQRWGRAIDPDVEVTITCGVTEGIVASVFSIAEPGDEVIYFDPAHENYMPAITLAGAVPRLVSLRPPDFAIDPDELKARITPRTRAIIINSPHNPSGRVFTAAELAELARLCIEHDLVLITDEIYEHIVFDGRRHIPPATLPGMADRTISVSGLGKTFAITGWRLGYIVAPPGLAGAVRKVHDFLTICAPAPLQAAATAAMSLPDAYFSELAGLYQERRDRFLPALRAAGLEPARVPEGAYYVLADVRAAGYDSDYDALEALFGAGVAAVPGSSFYEDKSIGRNLLRFAFCKRFETLDAGAERLAALRRR